MTIATRKLTFAEYLKYDDGSDTRYELVNGELVPMSIGTGQHGGILRFLERAFEAEIGRLGLAWITLQTAVGLRSPRAGSWDTSRIPDIVVIPPEQWHGLRHREAVIELNEPPPRLVVEVVSESTQRTDYRAKQAEYNILNIPEYWIVDPLESKVTVLSLVEDWYEPATFSDSDRIQSATFPDLALATDRVLNPC
jgi:Uma2 family endonuclease